MAFQFKNRVRGVSTTTGTGTYTVGAPPTGFQNFNQITSGRQVFYCALMGANWEVGIGTVTVGGSVTLSRDTILESSTGAAINWGSGDKEIFLVAPAEILSALTYDGTLRHLDISGTAKVTGISTLQGGVNVAGSIGGTTDAITAVLTPAITAYGNGMVVCLIPGGANTGAATLALNGLTARSIVKVGGAALIAGDLALGIPAFLTYDLANTRWVLLNPQAALPIANGGTGATTAANARTALGLGSMAVVPVTFSTSDPSGGNDGDLWFKYV